MTDIILAPGVHMPLEAVTQTFERMPREASHCELEEIAAKLARRNLAKGDES